MGALLSGLVLGCAPSASPPAASRTLAAYAAALRDHDAKRVRALLAPADQAQLSEAALADALAHAPAEAADLAARIARAPAPRLSARTVLDDGTEIELVQTEAGFRIVDPLSRFYGQDSPRATLLSFVRAVARSRWDVVRRLLPAATQKTLDVAALAAHFEAEREHWTRLVAQLSAHRDAPIEIVGERASMPYAESYTARFVCEEGAWKLESPE
jgi:hypothetical protein